MSQLIRKILQKNTIPICSIILIAHFIFTSVPIHAQSNKNSNPPATNTMQQFTLEEVARHNKRNDCYMIMDGFVYDFSKYLPQHDVFLDITSWCGKDISKDFRTKGGIGRDHRPRTYQMLENYKIGQIKAKALEQPTPKPEKTPKKSSATQIFNNFIAFFLTAALWFAHRGLISLAEKRNNAKTFFLSHKGFKFTWNFIYLLTAIPSVIFGLLLTLNLAGIPVLDVLSSIDILAWHVHGSLAFSFLTLEHIYRHRRCFFWQTRVCEN